MLVVERTLIQQSIAAVNAKYIKALRDPITNKIINTIPDILLRLFDAYGHVTKSKLYELKQKVKQMQFKPNKPVDTLITEINNLVDIADLANSTITDWQRVNMGYIILQRCKAFKVGLKEWNAKPLPNQTW